MSVHVIVLAAGKGTRMKSEKAKVLHEAAGRPLISWMLEALDGLDVASFVVIVGHQADDVAAVLPDHVKAVIQEPQLGTAHATEVGLDRLDVVDDDVIVVVPGDMPLITSSTLESLVKHHIGTGAIATLLSAIVDDPSGYGRVVRRDGDVAGIVEDVDLNDDERSIREINTAVYAFNAGALRSALPDVRADNQQDERYLPDVIGILRRRGLKVGAHMTDAEQGMGVNSQAQLDAVATVLERRAGG